MAHSIPNRDREHNDNQNKCITLHAPLEFQEGRIDDIQGMTWYILVTQQKYPKLIVMFIKQTVEFINPLKSFVRTAPMMVKFK